MNTVNKDCYQFDANLFIAYVLDENDRKELVSEVKKYIFPSNRGKRIIIIFTNELGEISKRLLKEYRESKLQDKILKNIDNISNVIDKGGIKILGFQELIQSKEDLNKFNKVLYFLNTQLGWDDGRVQQSDRVHLSLFALSEAKIYYTADGRILKSRKIIQFFQDEYDKTIKELSN
ncbi:MAG: hypothetical protein ACYDAO_08505 [Thermoplasmataceae archaeon]